MRFGELIARKGGVFLSRKMTVSTSLKMEQRVTFKSPVFEAIHSSVSGLFSIGAITCVNLIKRVSAVEMNAVLSRL